jgi:hypothetical protein
VQKDAAASHRPFEHSDAQQSPFTLHALPAVLHAVFSGVHVPDVQRPPQHSPSAVQFPPSEMHADALQAPLTQLTLQQSGPALHDAPEGRHTATVVHTCVVPSHVPEQQSPESVHAVPAPRHPGKPPPPPVPVALPVPEAPPVPDVAPVDEPPFETELSPAV